MPESHRFMRGLRAWVGFKQIGVPYVRPERMFGTTTNSFLKNLGWARRAIVSFSYAPLDLITGLALVVVAVSFVSLIVQLGLRIVDPSAAPQGADDADRARSSSSAASSCSAWRSSAHTSGTCTRRSSIVRPLSWRASSTTPDGRTASWPRMGCWATKELAQS